MGLEFDPGRRHGGSREGHDNARGRILGPGLETHDVRPRHADEFESWVEQRHELVDASRVELHRPVRPPVAELPHPIGRRAEIDRRRAAHPDRRSAQHAVPSRILELEIGQAYRSVESPGLTARTGRRERTLSIPSDTQGDRAGRHVEGQHRRLVSGKAELEATPGVPWRGQDPVQRDRGVLGRRRAGGSGPELEDRLAGAVGRDRRAVAGGCWG